VDDTMRNLLELLSTKLELCARLPVAALEAGREGHDDTATTFRRLADVERRSIEELKRCLLAELSATTIPAAEHGRRA
jgi:hypothetical protein